MARRVNAKFLVILVSFLVVAIAAIAGIWFFVNKIENNPVRLEKNAAIALKNGHITTAINLYQRACLVLAHSDSPQLPRLYTKLGELFYKSTSVDVSRFGKARGFWQAAIRTSPRYLKPLELTLQLDHAVAKASHDPQSWAQVLHSAQSVLAVDPKNATALRLAGMALIFSRAQVIVLTNRRYMAAEKDLKAAAAIEPQNIKVWTSLAQLYFLQAAEERRQNIISPVQARALREKGISVLAAFVHKYPKNQKAWLALWGLSYTTPSLRASAGPYLLAARKINPTSSALASADLKRLLIQHASSAELLAALRKLIASDPSNGNYYFLAGRLMAQFGNNVVAIGFFNASLKHPTPGEGIIPLINRQLRENAHRALVDAYLAMAGAYPAGSKLRSQYSRLAVETFRPIRQAQPNDPWVYVRQGEVRFVQGRLNSSLRWLRKGAKVLSPNDAADVALWVQDKEIQAQIYQELGQSGSALAQINDVGHRFGESPLIELKQAALLVQQNPKRALSLADAVLIAAPGNQAATLIKATVLGELGDMRQLARLLRTVDTTTNLQMAVLKTRFELISRHFRQAKSIMSPWLKKLPADPQVVRLAFAAAAGLGDRAGAKQIVAAAVKGDPKNLQFILLNYELANPSSPMPQVLVPSLTAPVQFQFSGKSGVNAEVAAIKQLKNPMKRNMLLARYYMAIKNYPKALLQLAAARKASPQSGQITTLEFQIALDQKNFKRAAQLVSRATRQNADGAHGLLFHADLLEAKGDFSGALQILHRLIRKNPQNAALEAGYGKILLQTGNVRQGIVELKSALLKKPNQIDALTAIVTYYLSNPTAPHLQAAQKLVNQGLGYDPLNVQFVRWNHQIQDVIGNPQPEIARRQGVLKAEPKNITNIIRLALLYVRVHRTDAALKLLRTTWKKNPDNLQLASVLGRLYMNNHQPTRAQGVFSMLAEASNTQVAFAGRMLLADYYQTHGRYAEAIRIYKSAGKANPPEKTLAIQRLADLYYALGKLNNALALYNPMLKASPDNRALIMRVAEIQIRLGHAKQALHLLNSRLLTQNPRDEQAIVLKGYAYLKENHLNASLKAINLALSLNPRDPNALVDQAMLKLSGPNLDYRTAIGDLLGVVQESPDNLKARTTLAAAYAASHHFNEAVLEYRQIVKIDPADATARVELLNLLYNLTQDIQSLKPNDQSGYAAMLRRINPARLMARTVAQAIALEPKSPQWLLWQSRLDGMLGHQHSAIRKAHEAYVAANRSIGAAVAYLQVLITYKQYQTAEVVATKTLALAPGVPGLYLARAIARSKLGQVDPSAQDFEKALRLTRHMPIAFLQAAGTFDQVFAANHHGAIVNSSLLGMLTKYPKDSPLIDTALASLDVAEHRFTDAINYADAAELVLTDPQLRVQAYTAAAVALYQEKHYHQSADAYRKALKIQPDDTQVLNNYAYTLGVRLKDPQAAQPYAEKANSLIAASQGASTFCRVPSVLDTLGWLRYRNGDMSGAIAAFERCITLPGATPEMYLHYGEVLAADKRVARARTVLQAGVAAAQKANDPVLASLQAALASLKG